MLDRYKKKGGFVQLLTLIETSNKQKQEQFLALIAQENVNWENALKHKALTIEKIFSWEAAYLNEVLSRLQPLTLATALHGSAPEKIESIISCLSNSEKRKITQLMSEANPTPAEKGTCLMKIVTEVRGMCIAGIVKLEKCAPDLFIPENFEEILNNQTLSDNIDKNLAVHSVPSTENKSETAGENKADPQKTHSVNAEELEFLKKKVNQLVSENNMLKHDIAVYRNKLEQIKKIA